MLRQSVIGIVLCAGLAAHAFAAAPAADEPKAIVLKIYGEMIKDTTFTVPENLYSPRLKQLFAADQADGKKGGGVGRLDWDAWVNGQDFDVKSVSATSRKDEFRDDREIVKVKMINFGKPAVVFFYFEKVKGHWQLDDIRWPGKAGWTLSLVLKFGSDFMPGEDDN